MRRGRHEHVNVIRRYRSSHNPDLTCMANLPSQIAGTLRYLSAQYLVSVLSDPHQVILDIAHRVPAMPILGHSLILVENRSKLTACKAVGLDRAMETKSRSSITHR